MPAQKDPGGKEAVHTEQTLQRTGRTVQDIYAAHADRVYRVAYLYMKNKHDSEDIVQDVFVRLIREVRAGKTFDSAEHEKAWLIVTAGNLCKNRLREKRRTELPLEDYDQLPAMDRETFYLFDAILSLPAPYKTAVYLFYYEGYRSDEIAAMLHERPAAPDGTELTVLQGEKEAFLYVYLNDSFFEEHITCDSPLSDADVDLAADALIYANIGR